MMYPKRERIKSEKHLKWVRSLECSVCGKPPPSVPHHIKGVGNFSGAGMKASDYLTCPMCATCHAEFHGNNLLTITYYVQYEFIVKTLDRAFQEGVIKI